jgi:serine phosphatase RsbU (regulator of sigma subunit)
MPAPDRSRSAPTTIERDAPGCPTCGGVAAATCAWREGDPPDLCRFREVTAFLSGLLGLDELLSACTAFVHGLVRAEHVRIWLKREGGRRLVARELAPTLTEGYREFRLSRGEGPQWESALEKMSRIAGPTPSEAGRGEVISGWQSALFVPLLRRDQVLGVIECRNKAGGGMFQVRDRRALEAVAGEFSVAIENAQLHFDARRRAAERATLLRVARSLTSSLTLADTLEAILDGLKRVVNYDAAAIFLLSKDGSQVEDEAGRGYPDAGKRGLELLTGQGIVGWVAKTEESVIVPDTSRDPRYIVARPTTRSEMACPLIADGKLIGVFNLESDREDAYVETHLEVLLAFASQAAAAIERARLLGEALERRHLERELAIAREIQLSFLPKSDPAIAGYQVAGYNLPYSEVGGDYYDFIRIVDNQTGIAISDVSGKGIPAALLMAAYRASLLAEIRNQYALRTIFAKVNTLLHESTDPGMFVTAFYGVLDSKNHVFTFSNAGHDPPYLLRAGGTIESLGEGGLPLGVFEEVRYEERPVSIGPGDVLLLYTDGVSEAPSPIGESFGTRRIEETLRELADRSAREIVDALVARVTEFADGTDRLADDVTIVCVKRLAEARTTP